MENTPHKDSRNRPHPVIRYKLGWRIITSARQLIGPVPRLRIGIHCAAQASKPPEGLAGCNQCACDIIPDAQRRNSHIEMIKKIRPKLSRSRANRILDIHTNINVSVQRSDPEGFSSATFTVNLVEGPSDGLMFF